MSKKYKIFDTLLIVFLLIVSLSLIGLSTYFALDPYDKTAHADSSLGVVGDNILLNSDFSDFTVVSSFTSGFNSFDRWYYNNSNITFNNNVLMVTTGAWGSLSYNTKLLSQNTTYCFTINFDSSNQLYVQLQYLNPSNSWVSFGGSGYYSSGLRSITFTTPSSVNYSQIRFQLLGNTSGLSFNLYNVKVEQGTSFTGFVQNSYLSNGYDSGFITGANSNSSIYKLGNLYSTLENDLQYQLEVLLSDYTGFIASDFVINVNGNYNFPFVYYKIVGSRYITIYSQNAIDNIDSVNVLTENFLSNNNVIMLWLFQDSEENISYLNVRASSVYEIINPPRYVYKIDNVNAYTIAYRNGFIAGSDVNTQLYNTGYNDGVDYANNTLNTNSLSYFKGREDGIESANTYSFYTLMDAVMVTPVRYAFEVFNFDFFGINIKSLLTTLFTMCLFALILKLCLKFIGV